MRHVVVILSFFLVFIFRMEVKAQLIFFPETNATWNYIAVDASNPPPIVFNYTFTITGDTTVNGVHYIKVQDFWNSFLFRQDSMGRVYGRYADPSLWNCSDTNELLIYDFSLSLTDSVYIHSCFNDSVLCIVTADDSITTNRGFRRMITLDISSGLLNCSNGITTIKWVEGIGSMSDLFYNFNFYQPGSICLQWYECISLDSSGYNINFLTDVIREVHENRPEFSVDDNGVFRSSVSLRNITVFNNLGKKVGEEIIQNETIDVKLPFLTGLPNGIYFFRVLTKENFNFEFKKILLNN